MEVAPSLAEKERSGKGRQMNTDPRLPQPKVIKVGVFGDVRASGKPYYMAYTTWYNPQWKGCCEHTVEAINGTAAKKAAIREHKEQCLPDPPERK